jgi:predicted nucleotide-binding protein
MGQPRQNVIFEAGLAMGSNRNKTILVQVGTLKGFSDIFGRHIPRLSNTSETRIDLINRLEHVGCKVIRQGTHWTKAGNFTPKSKAGSS